MTIAPHALAQTLHPILWERDREERRRGRNGPRLNAACR